MSYAQVYCKTHGVVGMGFAEYVNQMTHPDRGWVCPECKKLAEFDYEHFQRNHPSDAQNTIQERSKLEHTYDHVQVIQLVNAVMDYQEKIEDAVASLGKCDSMRKTADAQHATFALRDTLKPFKHLRSK